MKSGIIIYFILLNILLSGCTYKSMKPNDQVSRPNTLISASYIVLGSPSYVDELQKIADKSGNTTALYRIMDDVDKYYSEFVNNDLENNLRLYKLTSFLIYKIGYINMETHYFRNKLNQTPKSLEELIHLNSTLTPQKRWKLVPVANSFYHMMGKDGAYNLKFVSADGFCEAVYNKKGVLLTEKNDPENMGTFNFAAGISEPHAHRKYDVDPYLEWGNAAGSQQKGKSDILNGVNLAMKRYNENASKVILYRKKVMEEKYMGVFSIF